MKKVLLISLFTMLIGGFTSYGAGNYVYRGEGQAIDTYLREGTDWLSTLIEVTDPDDHVWYDQFDNKQVVFGNTQGQGSNVLMRYNLSAPPAGETEALYADVDWAILHMHVWQIFDDGGIGNPVTSPANPFEGNLVARPVLSGSGDWVAEEATWNDRKAGEAWTTGGGDVSEHIIGSYAYWSDGPAGWGEGNIWYQGFHIQMELQGSPDIGDGSLTALINSWTDPDNPGFALRLEDHTGPGVDLFVGRYQAVDDPSGTPWSAALQVEGTLIPEPGTLALLGLAGLLLLKRRRV